MPRPGAPKGSTVRFGSLRLRAGDLLVVIGDKLVAAGNTPASSTPEQLGAVLGGEWPAPGRNPDTDPLNYGNFGFDIVGTEVPDNLLNRRVIALDLGSLAQVALPWPGVER